MLQNELEKLENKILKLQRTREGYLEANDRAGIRRTERRIEEIEQQIELQTELSNINQLKQELSIYRKIAMKYPGIKLEFDEMLSRTI